MIWHYRAHANFLRNGGRSVDLAPTIISNEFLILAAVFTTALPVLSNIRREPTSVHELETGHFRHGQANSSKSTSFRTGQAGSSPHEAVSKTQDRYPPPKTPPPTKPLQSPPEIFPVTPPPSPLRPPLPLPPLPPQARLVTWPSRFTPQESRDFPAVEFETCLWSSIDPH